MRKWFALVEYGPLIRFGMILWIGLQILVGGGFLSWLSIFVVLLLVPLGTFWLWSFIAFFIAIARAVVNEDGHSGLALHPTVWSEGGFPKRRKVVQSAWEYDWVPLGLWRHESVGWPRIEVTTADVRCWPFSVGILVKLCAFLSSLHWPSTVDDLGVGGISYVELFILYERWAGESLILEMSVPKSKRADRPISVSAVPSEPSIDVLALL